MAKVIIPQSELPIPIGDQINKFRFRIMNENRNIFSDWSVIQYAYQQTIIDDEIKIISPSEPPGDVVITPTDPNYPYPLTTTPASTFISSNNIITTTTNHDIPPDGLKDQVLTKDSDTSYDVSWQYPEVPSPQDVHFAVGISMFA